MVGLDLCQFFGPFIRGRVLCTIMAPKKMPDAELSADELRMSITMLARKEAMIILADTLVTIDRRNLRCRCGGSPSE